MARWLVLSLSSRSTARVRARCSMITDESAMRRPPSSMNGNFRRGAVRGSLVSSTVYGIFAIRSQVSSLQQNGLRFGIPNIRGKTNSLIWGECMMHPLAVANVSCN